MYVSEILIITNGAFPVFAKITGGAKTLVTELALVRFFSSVHSEQKKWIQIQSDPKHCWVLRSNSAFFFLNIHFREKLRPLFFLGCKFLTHKYNGCKNIIHL